MRMDRYNETDTSNEMLKTRTNKNQELYTDVYMNNVYVDINNLKNVMKEEDEEKPVDLKLVKENKVVDYTYEDKIYNINTLIEEAIKNGQDNLKRSIDTKVDDMEIDSLIESINENKETEKKPNDLLLADLMPSSDNTSVIPPLDEPILETSSNSFAEIEEKADDLENKANLEEEKIEEELEEVKEEEQKITEANSDTKKSEDVDEEFLLDEKPRSKVVLIILIIVLLIAITLGIILFKNVI